MNTTYKFLAVLFCAVCLLPTAHATEIFVAPGGDDSHDGKSANAAFATIGRARDEIRKIKSAGELAAGRRDGGNSRRQIHAGKFAGIFRRRFRHGGRAGRFIARIKISRWKSSAGAC